MLLSQALAPKADEAGQALARPTLANQPAAASLLQGTQPSTPDQPIYDLPTFLASVEPQYAPEPRSPAYVWTSWVRQQLPADQAELLIGLDRDLQGPRAREEVLQVARLELAHLWHWQLHQAAAPKAGHGAEAQQRDSTNGRREAASATRQGSTGSDTAAAAPTAAQKGMAAGDATNATKGPQSSAASPTGSALDGDDIFAKAKKLRERKQEEAKLEQQQRQLQQLSPQQRALDALPLDLRTKAELLVDRELLKGESTSPTNVIGALAERFMRRLADGDAPGAAVCVGVGATAARDNATAGADGASLQQLQPLEPQVTLQQQQQQGGGLWVDNPQLDYTSQLQALVLRQQQMARGPRRGRKRRSCLAMAAAALDNARLHGSSTPPATPMLDLLADYWQAKYQDLLLTWEAQARLASLSDRIIAHRQAGCSKMLVSVRPPSAAGSAPAATAAGMGVVERGGASADMCVADARLLAAKLQGANASLQPAAARQQHQQLEQQLEQLLQQPIPLQEEQQLLSRQTDGDLEALFADAVARHANLWGTPAAAAAVVTAVQAPAGSAATVAGQAPAAPCMAAAFTEALTLDAASAMESRDRPAASVSMRFQLQELAHQAGLGSWEWRFLGRLLATPIEAAAAGSQPLMGDVRYSYCLSTDTVVLSCQRYPSRENGRRLLLEAVQALVDAGRAAAAAK